MYYDHAGEARGPMRLIPGSPPKAIFSDEELVWRGRYHEKKFPVNVYRRTPSA